MLLLILLSASLVSGNTFTDPLAANFTNAIRSCHHGSSTTTRALSDCLIKEINQARHFLGPGIPALNIPRLEPLLLEAIDFRQSTPPVTIEARFTDVHVTGATAFKLQYLDIDIGATREISLGMTIPSLYLLGRYVIGGNIFVLPIEGTGEFESLLDGIIAEGTGTLVDQGGQLKMVDVNIGFKIRDMDTTLHNLFEGNQLLSDTLHHFLKQNSQLVLDEVRPGVTKQLNDFITKLFNGVLKVLPREALELKQLQV